MKPTSCLLLLACATSVAHAQISLSVAAGLSAKNDPKVQSAAAEVINARAGLSQAKDSYVPVVNSEAGIGKSEGVPLGLPVIFSIQAQSLVFNWSQRDYIRSAHLGWNAADLALAQSKLDDAEDIATTYVSLSFAQQRRTVALDAIDHARRLVSIAEDRYNAGAGPHVEIPRANLQLNEMRLELNQIDTDIAELSDHLERETKLPAGSFHADSDSIPAMPSTDALIAPAELTLPAGIQAAYLTAASKLEQALGDNKHLYRPQIAFAANYSRITTDFSNYDLYYPAFNPANDTRPTDKFTPSYNALSVGVQISIPLLDMGQRAKARASMAQAHKSKFDADAERDTFLEGRLKMQRTASDLEIETQIAQDKADEQSDDLDTAMIQVNQPAPEGQVAVTPADEQKARIGLAQKKLDLLDTRLQLAKDKISLMHANGTLLGWISSQTPAR